MISLKSLLAEDIKKDVDKFIDKLNKQFPDQEYTISSGGGKYVRINHKSRKFGGESAWGFIALVDNPSKGFQKGDLLKAAGYNTPAKHARGNILNGTAKYDKYSPTYLKEELVTEGKWSKIMAGVRKGSQSGPWTIVIIQNKKVIHQEPVKYRDAIPASYEAMKRKFRNANLGIEDNSGQIVYQEKI